MQATTSAYAHNLKLSQLFLFLTGVEVDIGKCIHLVHNDVDVVASDTGRYNCYAFAFVCTGDGMEFATLNITLS